MPQIRPFTALRYSRSRDLDLSRLIAPPFDVLDAAGKAALTARSPNNIVAVDLPHLPAKTVGPDEAYARAAVTFSAWQSAGILERDHRPSFYPYTQIYSVGDREFHRRGFVALVRITPFGAGDVVPHEKTYKEAIVDRLKLMTATRAQLSPIFGLFNDPRGEANNLLYRNASRPEVSATLDGVRNDLWSISDTQIQNQVIDQLNHKPIYIADGHHRYTTAVEYQAQAVAANGGKPLPANHPANFCMFVLVPFQDDGLLILPTHRLIGGLRSFTVESLIRLIADQFEVAEATLPAEKLVEFTDEHLPKTAPHTMGLYDAATRKLYEIRPRDPDMLKNLEPNHSPAWRKLDVAILQRYLVEEILTPHFAVGELKKGYTANAAEVLPQMDGNTFQIAFLLKSTPLRALEDLGKTNEVMPQKSTYFVPKLATGMLINPLTYE